MMRRFPSIVLLAAATAAPAHPPAELAATYQVRLESAWPRLPGGGCENGGNETVEGTLTRSPGGEYEGTFTRRTRLLFCGAHAASGAACALVLDGEGSVQVHGLVTDDERSPSGRALRLSRFLGAPEKERERRRNFPTQRNHYDVTVANHFARLDHA